MNIMLLRTRPALSILQRSYKNFGHKREPIPTVTTLWHGFLTFTFIGFCLDWKKIGTWILGEEFMKKNEPIEKNNNDVHDDILL